MNERRKQAGEENAKHVPAKKRQIRGTASGGEHEARRLAARLVHAWALTPEDPPEAERRASQATRTAEHQPEPPRKALKARRYASRIAAAAAQALAEGEDIANKPIGGDKTWQSDVNAHVAEQALETRREVRRAEEAGESEEARRAQEERKADEARRAEDERRAAEEVRRAAEAARLAEKARLEEARATQERQEEAKRQDQERLAEESSEHEEVSCGQEDDRRSASVYSALMLACHSSGLDADMALRVFDQILEHCMDDGYRPTATNRRRRYYRKFFTLVAEAIGDERLRKDGLQILTAVRVHGIPLPLILQNRMVSAWGGRLPDQVLNYFEKMLEEGARLSGCITARILGSSGERGSSGRGLWTRSSPAGASTSQNEALAAGGPEVLHSATERTPLRTEASSFVPGCWKAAGQMPPEASILCGLVPLPPGLCHEVPQAPTQQIGCQRDECSTVMLRNLPCSFLREDLISEMDAKGFVGLYDFVYIPTDFSTQVGMGYGFVNLINNEEAQRFMAAFDGFRDWPRPSSKICAVDLSRTQGLDHNIWRHRNSPVMRDEVPERFRPVLFRGTERVPFLEFVRGLPEVRPKPMSLIEY